jgi:RNA-directed DNA polymerase
VSKISERKTIIQKKIIPIQQDLMHLRYQHASYHHFYVSDPKQRSISKASVRDRLVHQIVYTILAAIFDKKFIFHSFSGRRGKSTTMQSSIYVV